MTLGEEAQRARYRQRSAVSAGARQPLRGRQGTGEDAGSSPEPVPHELGSLGAGVLRSETPVSSASTGAEVLLAEPPRFEAIASNAVSACVWAGFWV